MGLRNIFFNLFILLPGAIFASEATITATPAGKLKSGESKEIVVTIDKPGISGPARLKIAPLPASSVKIEAISIGSATFKEKDGAYTFVWISVPESDKIEIKYRLIAKSGTPQNVELNTIFSYTLGEERINKEAARNTLTIEAEQAVASNPNPTHTTAPPINDVPKPLPTIGSNRKINKEGGNYMVAVTINKGSDVGFGRLKEDIPDGFTAQGVENEGAVFKFSDGSVKFLWSQLPTKKEFTVRYKLVPNSPSDGIKSIEGVFSAEFLIRGNENNDHSVIPTTFTYEAPVLVQNKPEPKPTAEEDLTKNTPGGYNRKPTEDEPAMITSTVPKTSTSSGVSYKVQVAAGKNIVESSYLKKKFVLKENVQREEHEGWYKYTVGNYSSLSEATKSMRDVRNTVSGAFVVAYSNGKRITLQEAQMLSK